MKYIDETKNYSLEEIKQSKLVSKKQKKVCNTLTYIEHLLTLTFAITGCIYIFAFASLLLVLFASIPIASSTLGIKIWAITAIVKKNKSVIEKKEETW